MAVCGTKTAAHEGLYYRSYDMCMTKKILLHGNSILLAGLAAKLQGVSGVAVTHSTTDADASADWDVVIVDLAGQAAVPPALWGRRNLRVVGVDAATGTLTVLSGQSYPVHSVDDVLQWLQNQAGQEAHPPTGPAK